MKRMTSSSIAISFLLILLTVNTTNAQSAECPGSSVTNEQMRTSSKIVITEDDYPCFKSIGCLKSDQKVKNKGWNITFKGDTRFPHEYIMESEATNMHLFARYDRRGDLIESTIYRKNTALPSPVRRQLVKDDLTGWTMIENEMFVSDFEPQKTEYKIVLEKEDKKQVLYFDNEGNRIQQLARR